MNRRRFLHVGGGLVATASTTGCLSGLGFRTRTVGGAPPVVANRPDAVYVPSHVEGMKVVGTAGAKSLRCALAYSYPHRFWLVTGRRRERVSIRSEDSVHLMATLWDAETGVVLPAGSLALDVTKDGESVASKPPWPMLSQTMGFHFGDNFSLPGDGTYEVEARVGALDLRRTGAFRDRFGEPASVSFDVEFSESALSAISYERLDDGKGQRGALDPMAMGMVPSSRLPAKADLPGSFLGSVRSGDGAFLVTALDAPPDGVDAPGPYLAVSARTPYNGYPLPLAAMSGTVERDGETVFDGPLAATLDPSLGYHYGTTVERLRPGDLLTLSVDAPPQVARHEGYETAFLEMPPMALTVPA